MEQDLDLKKDRKTQISKQQRVLPTICYCEIRTPLIWGQGSNPEPHRKPIRPPEQQQLPENGDSPYDRLVEMVALSMFNIESSCFKSTNQVAEVNFSS